LREGYDKKVLSTGGGFEMRAFLFGVALVLLSVGSAGAQQLPVTVPALGVWGMAGTAATMGLSGLYVIFKRRK
jgi:hypothetical protein